MPYLNISEVTGRFSAFTGKASLDQNQKIVDVLIQIGTTSIETGNKLRDGHLKSHEFLRSKEFPVIIFRSSAIQELGPSKYKATGELVVKGISKQHILSFEVTAPIKDTWSYESRFVKFNTVIDRKKFNLVWNKTLVDNKYLVGDLISVWGTLQLQKTGSATPSSKHMIPDTSYIRRREKMARGELAPDPAGPTLVPVRAKKEIILPEVVPALPVKKNVTYDKDFRDTLSWQVSFGFLGLMGFFASIIIGLYLKKIISQKYPGPYQEGGKLGIMTDSVSIIFILLYVVALWEVGWG